jgi:hypothetical protein
MGLVDGPLQAFDPVSPIRFWLDAGGGWGGPEARRSAWGSGIWGFGRRATAGRRGRVSGATAHETAHAGGRGGHTSWPATDRR